LYFLRIKHPLIVDVFLLYIYNLPLFRFYVEIISYLHSNENTLFLYCLLPSLLIAQGRTAINNSTYKSESNQKILLHLLINTVLFLLIAIRLT
jgi:hypothetical protein